MSWQVRWLPEVSSTNALLKQEAAQGAPHGTVVATERQTAGRGRLGRRFVSPEGGVYLSVLLRPHTEAGLRCLTAAAAVAVCRAVRTVCGIDLAIKWRNDLLLNGKKVCGILTELSYQASQPDYAIIGIGINCNTDPSAFPTEVREIASSIKEQTGKTVDTHRLAAELTAQLAAMDAAYPKLAPYMDEYAARCVTVGQELLVLRNGEARPAAALSVDAEGALLVRYETGETELLSTGEVSVRGKTGYAAQSAPQ